MTFSSTSKRSITRHIQRFFLRRVRSEQLEISVYCRLVESIFGTIGAFIALSLGGFILAGLVFFRHPSIVTLLSCVTLITITVLRLIMMRQYLAFRRRTHRFILKDALRWEAMYTLLGVPLMICISGIASFAAATTDDHLLTIVSSAMIMAIGAVIASRNGGRPMIAKYQNAALCLPYGTTLILSGSMDMRVTGIMTGLYYVGILSATKTTYMTLRNALVNGQRAKAMSVKAARQASLLGAALNNMSTGLMMFDSEKRLLVSNAKAYEFFGESALKRLIRSDLKTVAEHVYSTLGSTDQQIERIRAVYYRVSEIAAGFSFDLTDHIRSRSFDVRFNRIEDDGGFVISIDDITERRLKDDQIERLAHRDPLTELHNRYSLLEKMREASLKKASVVGVYLDLDGFKAVNDTEGHTFGDQLLIGFAERLRQSTASSDIIARIGGDEFFILFGSEMAVSEAEEVTARIFDEIRRPLEVNSRIMNITASAGISQIVGVFDPETLIKRADVALYEAKTQGRDRWVRFEDAMEERATLSLMLEAELKRAAANDELSLVYQPIIDSDTGRTVCCEALMRWNHPTRGMIAPFVFIPLAEQSSLICDLGTWALARACQDAMRWPDPSVKVAVNISARHFKSDKGSVLKAIEEALAISGLVPARLQIEITESVLASDIERMRQELEAINAMGVSIALDDFGTGYSSLSYIHRLPINKIKLDRSFVVAIAKDPRTIKFVASIVQMAQTLRKELIIEGVETAEELALLRSVSARIIQGYHFSRPLPCAEVNRYITRSNPSLETVEAMSAVA
jgi:diguanylate cyclase (GGDEF)-like protein